MLATKKKKMGPSLFIPLEADRDLGAPAGLDYVNDCSLSEVLFIKQGDRGL